VSRITDFFKAIPVRSRELWASYRAMPRNRQILIGGGVVVGLILLIVVLAALFGGGSSTPTTTAAPPTTQAATTTTTSTTSTTPTTVPVGEASPLNGIPAEDPANLNRRVLAVKIDNHPDAKPQSGIQDADLVFELPVEGITRLIALFHDNDSDYLGPIRSGRPTDPTLIKPAGATFIISGAQPWIQAVISAAEVDRLEEPRPGTFRIDERFAPHNLYGNTDELRGVADEAGYSDDPPTEWWAIGDFAGGDPAPEVFLNWAPGDRVLWTWDGTQYLRFHNELPHNWIANLSAPSTEGSTEEDEGEEGDEPAAEAEPTEGQLSTDVLVVVMADAYVASPPGGDGSAVPAMETVGTGTVHIFANGEHIEGAWERTEIDQPFLLTAADGAPLLVPPGRPWVSIFPQGELIQWGENALDVNP